MKTHKIRFIEEGGKFTLQKRDCFWRWETCEMKYDLVYIPLSAPSKDLCIGKYLYQNNLKRENIKLIEYPTIKIH